MPESRTAKQPAALLAWMGSLADATRLRLLHLLERHELGVLELCDVLQLPQSTVSRHLKVLGDQAWLSSRAQGTNRLYRMAAGECDAAARKLWLVAREQTIAWPTVEQDRLRLTRRLSEREPAAQAFFAGAAGRWDKLRGELYGEAFGREAVLSLLPPDWVVADLGCGTGQNAAVLARFVREVIGIDQSPAMLKAARRRMAGERNVVLRQGSLEALPLENESVDGALLVLALTYVSDPRRALAEMARILRPGGRAVVVDLLRHDREAFQRQMGQQNHGFTPEVLAGLLEGVGLTGAACRALPPEPQASGPALVLASAQKASRIIDRTERRTKRKKEEAGA
jgi:ubiquinone/menaquinone biosynthesis C-methylase UbiE/DNA-binding transcriptional ArsR family regulator